MISSDNYVLYMDSTYSIKVKSINGEMSGGHFNGRRYVLEGIDTEFFILAVFIENKRQDGFEFDNTHVDSDYHTDNLFMKSIINDLGMTDLNMIPMNHFLQANKKVVFSINKAVFSSPTVDIYQGNSFLNVKNQYFYGHVRPTFKIVNPDYVAQNSFRVLAINHMYTGLTEAVIFPSGFPYGGFIDQFFSINDGSGGSFQELPSGSSVFQIDDIYLKIDFKSDFSNYFQFRVECDIDNNFVNLSLDSNYRVNQVVPNFGGKTAWLYVIDALNNDGSLRRSFDVLIDWKKIPELDFGA
ncbi:hypothetical protein ACEN2I_02045 [Flavobacterium sp. W22_SRS_FK3]|uniref:hypothetical protein n=1 Tax=Flavobacterium sp. W22_SRS_FK3 TaxID=3240275 RepID=UPI003F92224F